MESRHFMWFLKLFGGRPARKTNEMLMKPLEFATHGSLKTWAPASGGKQKRPFCQYAVAGGA